MQLPLEPQYMLSVIHIQYHTCWCSSDFWSPSISKHGADPQSWNIPKGESDNEGPWLNWRLKMNFCNRNSKENLSRCDWIQSWDWTFSPMYSVSSIRRVNILIFEMSHSVKSTYKTLYKSWHRTCCFQNIYMINWKNYSYQWLVSKN